MISKTIGIAALAATFVLPIAIPAHATSTSTKPLNPNCCKEQQDVVEREQIRRQQVRQNRGNGLFEPIFAPLYKGSQSPVQKVKRTFD